MSEKAELWGLRLLALMLAIAFWYFAAVERRERVSERVLDVAVTYNTPRGVIILDPIQAVKVRLRGSERQLRGLNPASVGVVVAPNREEPGNVEVHLVPESVVRPDNLEVVSIEPTTIRLQLDREATRLLPVRPRLAGEPAAGAVPLAAQPLPDSVLVSGPETRLRAMVELSTGPVSLDGHALDFEETVIVLSSDALVRIVNPSVVTVRVRLAQPETEPPAADLRKRHG